MGRLKTLLQSSSLRWNFVGNVTGRLWLVIGLGFAGLSSWIANSWVTKQSLSPADIRMAIILGGITLAARWSVAFYTGILQGLERQMLQTRILVTAARTRAGLMVVALLFVSRTAYCFLVTQALANVGLVRCPMVRILPDFSRL